MKKVCVVTGVGPGTGTAIVKRFASEFQVAMIARDNQRLLDLSATVPDSHAYACDVSDSSALTNTLDQIKSDLGNPEVVVHNAVGGAFGDFLSIKTKTLMKNF